MGTLKFFIICFLSIFMNMSFLDVSQIKIKLVDQSNKPFIDKNFESEVSLYFKERCDSGNGEELLSFKNENSIIINNKEKEKKVV